MKAILSTLLLLCFGGRLMTCSALRSPFLTPKTQAHAASASSADDYSIVFTRDVSEDFNLHVVCTFTLRFADADTVAMRFGGDPEISVSDLEVRTVPATAWNRDAAARSIAFAAPAGGTCRVRMEYDYCNLTSAFLYAMHGCELWETSYQEWYYPVILGQRARFDLRCDLPAGLCYIGGYPAEERIPDGTTESTVAEEAVTNIGEKHSNEIRRFETPRTGMLTSHSCVFALVDTSRYGKRVHTLEGDTLYLWFMRKAAPPDPRVEELHRLTLAATAYFEKCLGPYDDSGAGISGHPVYLFHSNGYSNRNNLNLISVSQAKFATKPHLLPIVHEIGHRWLGEWTLFVPDETEAAYFLKESLDEYMTLSFAREYYGEAYFRELFKTEYTEPVRALRGTDRDRCLIDMRRNDNDAVVYAKGPLVIEQVAKEMGYERWIAFMQRFYTAYRYRPLTYEGFIGLLAEADAAAAEKLDSLVRHY